MKYQLLKDLGEGLKVALKMRGHGEVVICEISAAKRLGRRAKSSPENEKKKSSKRILFFNNENSAS